MQSGGEIAGSGGLQRELAQEKLPTGRLPRGTRLDTSKSCYLCPGRVTLLGGGGRRGHSVHTYREGREGTRAGGYVGEGRVERDWREGCEEMGSGGGMETGTRR